jgi:hypothetical protein
VRHVASMVCIQTFGCETSMELGDFRLDWSRDPEFQLTSHHERVTFLVLVQHMDGVQLASRFKWLFLRSADHSKSRGLIHELSSLVRTLVSWIRFPLEAKMYVYVYSVCVVLCVGSCLARG